MDLPLCRKQITAVSIFFNHIFDIWRKALPLGNQNLLCLRLYLLFHHFKNSVGNMQMLALINREYYFPIDIFNTICHAIDLIQRIYINKRIVQSPLITLPEHDILYFLIAIAARPLPQYTSCLSHQKKCCKNSLLCTAKNAATSLIEPFFVSCSLYTTTSSSTRHLYSMRVLYHIFYRYINEILYFGIIIL